MCLGATLDFIVGRSRQERGRWTRTSSTSQAEGESEKWQIKKTHQTAFSPQGSYLGHESYDDPKRHQGFCEVALLVSFQMACIVLILDSMGQKSVPLKKTMAKEKSF